MSGFDDHVAIMGDWMAPSPSPRSYFSSIINDDVVAQSVNSTEEMDQSRGSKEGDEASRNKSNRGGGLMERIAARAGFNAPRLNTQNIRPTASADNSQVRSPYLTIPPGLSPTTLFDSPVFLSNSLVQASPTTGKFLFASSGNNQNSTLMIDDSDKGKENTFEDVNALSFAFKPVPESSSFPYFNEVNQSFPTSSDTSLVRQNLESLKVDSHNNEANISISHAEMNRGINLSSQQTYNATPPPVVDEPHEDVGGSPAEDGYNWRKYGQKQVKGSEYPRSYYKCTHQNCPVKKKVERSPEGHITEIIYKGTHNHPEPPPNRRSALGSSNAIVDTEQLGTGPNGDVSWSTMQKGNAPDWRQENLEATSLGQEYNNGQAQNGAKYESVDGSLTFSNDEDEDDRVTHGSVSIGYDGEGDESESKRRRIESFASEVSGATRAIREPRVVVQTTSEVDILDDGYRWRKYGQKVVKGNPNPRSYYKCTSNGCNVRKHVERASHDLKSVITTYEGKHNHDVPAARNSSHNNSTQHAPPPPPTANSSQNILSRSEPSQIHGGMARFERQSLGSFSLPMGPGHGFSYGMNQAGLASMGLAGLRGPVHNPYLGHQARPMNDMMGFMMPKGEPKLEPLTDSDMNASSSSSVYQQLMSSRLPLGP
ncbi:hypothetical protein ACJIZ3_006854 [Penstemon smallii]|uniref:WRKY domain-containing protein n=1 Tax=Penstemon smallii TaxID=265156 RepID=A0ABD3S8Y1_9LAMI